jgi:hypothetical protein
MDSPLMTRVLRRLFSHDTCSTSISTRRLTSQYASPARRHYVTSHRTKPGPRSTKQLTDTESWQRRPAYIPGDEHLRYPTVTAEQLRQRIQRPKKVKMLLRDFIDGWSLVRASEIRVTNLFRRQLVQSQLRLLSQ